MNQPLVLALHLRNEGMTVGRSFNENRAGPVTPEEPQNLVLQFLIVAPLPPLIEEIVLVAGAAPDLDNAETASWPGALSLLLR